MEPLRLDPERFEALTRRLGLDLPVDIAFDELARCWAEPHRAYHTTEHLLACLATLDGVRHLADRPDEVEWALWYHDAVYRTRGGGSEEASADLSDDWLARGGAPDDVRGRVRALILATKHDAEPPTPDAALLVDVDLAILGAPPDAYDRYEAQVRREYRWVPGPLFRHKRREVLQGFLERPRLYATDAMRDRLEIRARDNLERAIAALGGSP